MAAEIEQFVKYNYYEDTNETIDFDELVYQIDQKKRNILINSPGGTGKSYLLKNLYDTLIDKNIKVCKLSTTGISALNIGGKTVHSWAGVGLAKEEAVELFNKINRGPLSFSLRAKWKNIQAIMLDEISMLGKGLFEKLDYIGRRFRKVDKPFGGIIIIASGDMLQLPPVKDSFPFESGIWSSFNFLKLRMKEGKRFNTPEYYDMLLRIRRGELTDSDIKKLKKRKKAYKKNKEELENGDLKPTILCSLNVDVDALNELEMDKLEGNVFTYVSSDTFTQKNKKYKYDTKKYGMLLNSMIPNVIALKEGAQVMLLKNIDQDVGLVNGSRGYVKECQDNGVIVRFKNGLDMFLENEEWEFKDDNVAIVRTQLPIKLAFAMSIHKSQGSTLDYCVIDIGDSIFSGGQAYVALSRAKDLDCMFIRKLKIDKIYPNQIAKKYEDDDNQYVIFDNSSTF